MTNSWSTSEETTTESRPTFVIQADGVISPEMLEHLREQFAKALDDGRPIILQSGLRLVYPAPYESVEPAALAEWHPPFPWAALWAFLALLVALGAFAAAIVALAIR